MTGLPNFLVRLLESESFYLLLESLYFVLSSPKSILSSLLMKLHTNWREVVSFQNLCFVKSIRIFSMQIKIIIKNH